MKKLTTPVVALCVTASICLCACSGEQSAAPETTSQPVTEQLTTESVMEEEPATRDLTALAANIPFDPDHYTDIVNDIPYSDDGEDYHLLDLYGTASAEPAPTVIEIHGGGFIGGSRSNNAGHSIFFAERGYKVVTPDYSKVPRHGDFTAVIQDLFSVFHWVEEQAGEKGFDLNNIFISGDSAGGYYALACYAICQSPELQEYFGVTAPSFQFTTCVATCPAADILHQREYLKEESGPNAHVAKTIGQDLLLNEDLMAHMDLMSCVPAETFHDIYMMTTPTDTVTGVEVAAFDAYLTENGVEHTVRSYDGAENEIGHTFNISHADFAESKVANQDMVDFMNARLK